MRHRHIKSRQDASGGAGGTGGAVAVTLDGATARVNGQRATSEAPGESVPLSGSASRQRSILTAGIVARSQGGVGGQGGLAKAESPPAGETEASWVHVRNPGSLCIRRMPVSDPCSGAAQRKAGTAFIMLDARFVASVEHLRLDYKALIYNRSCASERWRLHSRHRGVATAHQGGTGSTYSR